MIAQGQPFLLPW